MATDEGKSKKSKSMLNGAVAGVAARTISAPIDLLKIRFQMQKSAARPYPSIFSAISAVCKQEGPLGFWKGNMAGIYLYATYSAVQFGIYEELTHKLERKDSLTRGLVGSIAAMGATFVSYPFDLIRTRHCLQASTNKHYDGLMKTVKTIVREEGIRGVYKGLGPSLAQVMPYMGIAFASFDYSTKLFVHLSPRHSDMIAGGISGFVSKLCMMPVDVIRKRLQIQGSLYRAYVLCNLPVYAGLADCVRSIWRVEGIRGFYSGLTLALFKSVPATMTTFVVYGFLNRLSSGSNKV